MGNWKTLTGDNIQLLDTEVTIMASVSPLQDLDTCVLNASETVRGYVRGGGYDLEPAPSVPPECVDDTIAIARYNYLAQEPTGTLLTKIRQDQNANAYAHLRDVAKDISAVTDAVIPNPPPGAGGLWGSQQQIAMRTNPT